MLRTELAEIHKHWPGTPVVVIGHSNGGFVSMDYWAEARAKGEPLNADLVMSLDSPINGVKNNVPFCKLVEEDGFACGYLNIYEELWHNQQTVDSNIVSLDGDLSYRAFGTIGDPTYVQGDHSGFPPIIGDTSGKDPNDVALCSQLVFSFDCREPSGQLRNASQVAGLRCTDIGAPALVRQPGAWRNRRKP